MKSLDDMAIQVYQNGLFIGYIKSISYKDKTFKTVSQTSVQGYNPKFDAKGYKSHEAIMKDITFLRTNFASKGYTFQAG